VLRWRCWWGVVIWKKVEKSLICGVSSFIYFLCTDEPKYWYFEIIIIMHKCIMTGAMVIVENGSPTQPLVAMLIQLMFMLLVLKLAPCK